MLVLTRRPDPGDDTIVIGDDIEIKLLSLLTYPEAAAVIEIKVGDVVEDTVTLHSDERYDITQSVVIGVTKIEPEQVRVGVEAPKTMTIVRQEIIGRPRGFKKKMGARRQY